MGIWATEYPDFHTADVSRQFLAYVHDSKTGGEVKEWRELRFWFEKGTIHRVKRADDFMTELLQPKKFPKNNILYVKRLITQLRAEPTIHKIEVEMRPLEEGEEEQLRSVKKKIARVKYTAPMAGGTKMPTPQELLSDHSIEENGVSEAVNGEDIIEKSVVVNVEAGDRRDEEGIIVQTLQPGDLYVQPLSPTSKRTHSD